MRRTSCGISFLEDNNMAVVIGIALIVMAVFLVISILLQSSKDHRLSGTIAGGAETFFGKQKGKTVDSFLNKITAVVCALFFICVIAMFIVADDGKADVIVDDSTVVEDQVIGEDNEISDSELVGEDETTEEDNTVVEDETTEEDNTVVEDETSAEDEAANEVVTE